MTRRIYEGENPRDNGDLRAPREDFTAEGARARELARLLIEHVAAAGAAGYELRIDGFALAVTRAPENEQGEPATDEVRAAEGGADWSYRTPADPLTSKAA